VLADRDAYLKVLAARLADQPTTSNARTVKSPRPRRALGRAGTSASLTLTLTATPTAIGARLRRTAVFEPSDCPCSARQRLTANSGANVKTGSLPDRVFGMSGTIQTFFGRAIF